MKKLANHTTRRALILDRETVRRLSSAELGHVAGGTDVSQGTQCRTWCTPCTGAGGGPKLE